LPEECFRHYLEQDYLFLIHFSRAWALAVYKSDTLADMRAATSTLDAILNYEMELHVKYCAGWGLKEQEMERANEAKANMAYTRYVLERGLAGDVLDLHVALAPCVIGYAVIGKNLDKLATLRLGPGRFENLVKTFRQATILEIGFWDMGLNLQF
jgi:thiaminase/transcriptional activator TenA